MYCLINLVKTTFCHQLQIFIIRVQVYPASILCKFVKRGYCLFIQSTILVSFRGFYNIGGPGGGGPDSGGPDGGGSDGGGPDGGGPEGGGPDGGGPDGGVSVVTVYTFVESKYLLTPAMFTSQSYLL